jgi:septum formation protein
MDVDEQRLLNEPPAEYVTRLAALKARALWDRLGPSERLPVLGADTTVTFCGECYGKPRDQSDGIAMLRQLSGRTHQVMTAVALCFARDEHTVCDVRLSVSQVTFGNLTEADCLAYWQSGEPRDKAGGYAVQGLAASFITRIEGSYSAIMGLPLAETAELLRAIGWSLQERTSDG